jgi:DNA-binding transcriptional MocR family regulator
LQALARASLDADCPEGYALELTHGAVDGIERLLAAWLLPGDRIAVEDPCFLGSLNVLNAVGHAPLPVAVDAHGMQVESLRQALEAGARAVLLTPRAHNPTGASLDAKRARALRQLLAAYPQVAVLIDDHYAALAAGLPLGTAAGWPALGAAAFAVQAARPRPAAGLAGL